MLTYKHFKMLQKISEIRIKSKFESGSPDYSERALLQFDRRDIIINILILLLSHIIKVF